MKSAYLMIAHGSRSRESNEAFHRLVDCIRGEYVDRLIESAFLEMVKPSIPEGIEACIQKGAQSIIVVPLMLFPGRHVKEDIPRFIQEAKEKYPNLDFHYSGPLCENPKLKELLEIPLQS